MDDFPGTISGIFRKFRKFRKISEKFPNFGISEIRKIPEISENFPRRVFFEIFYIFLYFTLCTDVFAIIKNYKNYWTDIYRGWLTQIFFNFFSMKIFCQFFCRFAPKINEILLVNCPDFLSKIFRISENYENLRKCTRRFFSKFFLFLYNLRAVTTYTNL